jgi:hypothetical protein
MDLSWDMDHNLLTRKWQPEGKNSLELEKENDEQEARAAELPLDDVITLNYMN